MIENNNSDQTYIDLVQAGKKLEAIKIYKENNNSTLKEAKEYIDELLVKNGIVSHLSKKSGCMPMMMLLVVLFCSILFFYL